MRKGFAIGRKACYERGTRRSVLAKVCLTFGDPSSEELPTTFGSPHHGIRLFSISI